MPASGWAIRAGVLPYSVLVGADGRVLKTKIGPFDDGDIAAGRSTDGPAACADGLDARARDSVADAGQRLHMPPPSVRHASV